MTLPAPFPPLVAGGEGLETYPAPSVALTARMAALHGVATDQVLPVRGVTHGLELIWRMAARQPASVEAPDGQPFEALSRIYGRAGEPAALVVRSGPSLEALTDLARSLAPALLVVDEGAIEFGPTQSASALIPSLPNLVVLRSLSLAHGLAGARVGAVLAQAETLARLADCLEPHALPLPSIRLALQALDPSRMLETQARLTTVRGERGRVARSLASLMSAEADAGPRIRVRPADPVVARAALAASGIDSEDDGATIVVPVSLKPEVNDRLLAALGVVVDNPRVARRGQAVRDTNETRIVCAVDLDAAGPVEIRTGVGFFDHMLEQVAAHGGFSLRLSCEGDLHTDPHHTIEDCAIALGQALKQALGERRGIARYGFVLPMDEAEATVSIDLSGRPYPVFEGHFSTAMIGDYRTDLTAHVVRSVAEHLGAAIHVRVTGDDDHHKTEAVYKALGRTLRQAIRIEDGRIPSTKGVL